MPVPLDPVLAQYEVFIWPLLQTRPPRSTLPTPLHFEVARQHDRIHNDLRYSFCHHVVLKTYREWIPGDLASVNERTNVFLTEEPETAHLSTAQAEARRATLAERRDVYLKTMEWIRRWLFFPLD